MSSLLVFTLLSVPALAQEAEAVDAGSPPTVVDAGVEPTASPSPFTLGGYVEAVYQWNFNAPSNGITHFRAFDNRHNSFTVSNVALDAAWDDQRLIGKLTLQVGHTPSTYYLAEPVVAGASGANLTGPELWKYVQQAYGGYRFDVGGGLAVTAGIFLSPIGPEGMAVRDNWNWSRSNLFFGLPFYHTGVRAQYSLSKAWTATLAGYNGWNSVVDNNREKSVTAQIAYATPELSASLLYFGGVERAEGALEGRPWRHLVDANATWQVTERLALMAHVNAGLEPNRFGLSGWAAGALYGRVQLKDWLFVAVRGDFFAEFLGSNTEGTASPIFWPAPWVSSGTATIDVRPHARVSFRLEYRHDHAGAPMFFGGQVNGEGAAVPFEVNRTSQDTLSLGMTAWF